MAFPQDDFDAIGDWQPYGNTPVFDGQLHILGTTSGVYKTGTFTGDLTTERASVKLTANQLVNEKGGFFYVHDPSDGYRLYHIFNPTTGNVEAHIRTSSVDSWNQGPPLGTYPLAGAVGKYFGLREIGPQFSSVFHWQVSDDGINWTDYATFASPWGFQANPMSIAYYAEGGGSITFDKQMIVPSPPAEPVIQARDDANAVFSTSLSIDFGAVQPAGRLLIFAMSTGAGDPTGTLTLPSGVTEVGVGVSEPTGNGRIRVFQKITGSSEPATYTFSWPNNYWVGVEAVAITNFDTTTPVQAAVDEQGFYSTSQRLPPITVPTNGGLLLSFLNLGSGGVTVTSPPAGYTEQFTSAQWPIWYERTTSASGTIAAADITLSNNSGTAVKSVFIGSQPVGGAAGAPASTSLPTITGPVLKGSPLTAHLGSFTNAPTSYAYRFAYAENYGGIDGIGTDYNLARTIPGTSNTTTNASLTPTYTPGNGDIGRNMFFEVTATNAIGSVTVRSSAVRIHPQLPAFRVSENPWLVPLPDNPPIDAGLTSTLRTQLQTWSTNRKGVGAPVWYPQGGDYGDSWSSYLNVVDNSMTREPIILIGIDSNDIATGLTQPRYPPIQNSENPKSHLAWCLSERDGGVPQPPGGVMFVGGNDMHVSWYNVDTGMFIDTWVTLRVPNAPSFVWGGTTVTPHNDYKGKIVCMYGGYIRNVAANKGYWGGYWDTHQTGDWAVPYNIDQDGNREYSSWGAMATGIPYFGAPTILESELLAGEIPHMIGVITPGSNNTHNYPATRHDVGAGSNLPQGGIWQLDPSIDVDALPTLGWPEADQMRSMILKACQRYGMSVIDSTGQGLAFRFESVNGQWPNIENVYSSGNVDYDALMESVPYTAWRMIDPAYRAAVVSTSSPGVSLGSQEILGMKLGTQDVTALKLGNVDVPLPTGGVSYIEGSDAPQAGAALAAMWGGSESGSWLTTKLPNNTAVHPGSAAAITEIVRQKNTYTSWINGAYGNNFTSFINVVPDDAPMTPVILERSESYAQTLKSLLAAGVPIPASGITLPGEGDTDAEMLFIQPSWERTYGGTTWRGRMYETWVTYKDGTGWHCYWGGRMVGILDDENGHPYDWWWDTANGPDPFGVDGAGTEHNYLAQATGIPLSHTMITRRDLQRGVIDHPVHFMLCGADGTHPQAGPVWPAQRYDGSSVDVLPQGSRLRLPYNYNVTALPEFAKIISQAAKDYGMVFSDTAAQLALRMEPGAIQYLTNQSFNPTDVVNAIPWQDMQLMAVGSDTTQNVTA